jgi:hypothetical protein
MILLQLCAIAGVLLQFRCNSGAILVQFWCNSGAILVQFWCNSGAILVQFWCNSGAICTCDWRQLAATWGDSKLATLIVIGRAVGGSATGRHQ